jgi:hypothetical protein
LDIDTDPSNEGEDEELTNWSSLTIEELLNKLHQILLQCQAISDLKVRTTGQIMEILSSKTRQLGLDTKTMEERKFHVELDEAKILNEFKMAIKSSHRSSHNNRSNINKNSTITAVASSSKSTRHVNINENEINKAVSKYIKNKSNQTSSHTNNNNKKSSGITISNTRNHSHISSPLTSSQTQQRNGNCTNKSNRIIDAYSFDDQFNGMDNHNNSSYTIDPYDHQTSSNVDRNFINISNYNKKSNKYHNSNRTNKKFKNENNENSNKMTTYDFDNNIDSKYSPPSQTTTTRSKRQLNYNTNNNNNNNGTRLGRKPNHLKKTVNNNINDKELTNVGRKRRLDQLKSMNDSSNSILMNNNNLECKSPSSSSSTTSTSTITRTGYKNKTLNSISNDRSGSTRSNININNLKKLNLKGHLKKKQKNMNKKYRRASIGMKVNKNDNENDLTTVYDDLDAVTSRLRNRGSDDDDDGEEGDDDEEEDDDDEVDEEGDDDGDDEGDYEEDYDDNISENGAYDEQDDEMNSDNYEESERINVNAANRTSNINNNQNLNEYELMSSGDESTSTGVGNLITRRNNKSATSSLLSKSIAKRNRNIPIDNTRRMKLTPNKTVDEYQIDQIDDELILQSTTRLKSRQQLQRRDNSATDSDSNSGSEQLNTTIPTAPASKRNAKKNNASTLNQIVAASGITNTPTASLMERTEDEPVYCTCKEISYGQMICCDNDGCLIEWFHFDCVSLTSKPKGKWYCPHCRGDNHKVMKKVSIQQTISPHHHHHHLQIDSNSSTLLNYRS